jgi:acetyl esterase
MPVHPEAQQLLDALRAAGMPPFEAMTVPQAREAAKGFLDLQGEPENIAVDNRTIPGPAGDLPVRIYTPDGSAGRPLLVYFHGGGWVIGDLETVDKPLRSLALRSGVVVLSVDYRLAPEHVYPAAFDDSYAATVWAAQHAAELGADPAQVVVGGDSAGGNLAAAVALAARDRGGPQLAGQLLIYPVTDFDFTTRSYEDNGEGYLLQRATMQWFWAHYLGAADLGKDPYAAPLRADNLVGLPPAFVMTCEFDPLRDEGEAYAARLRDAGVAVSARRYDGMLHGFLWTLGATPSGAVAFDDLSAALRAMTGRRE